MMVDVFNNVCEKIEQIELLVGYELIWYGEYKVLKDVNEGLVFFVFYGFVVMIFVVVFMFNVLCQLFVIWMIVFFVVVGVIIGFIVF